MTYCDSYLCIMLSSCLWVSGYNPCFCTCAVCVCACLYFMLSACGGVCLRLCVCVIHPVNSSSSFVSMALTGCWWWDGWIMHFPSLTLPLDNHRNTYRLSSWCAMAKTICSWSGSSLKHTMYKWMERKDLQLSLVVHGDTSKNGHPLTLTGTLIFPA